MSTLKIQLIEIYIQKLCTFWEVWDLLFKYGNKSDTINISFADSTWTLNDVYFLKS